MIGHGLTKCGQSQTNPCDRDSAQITLKQNDLFVFWDYHFALQPVQNKVFLEMCDRRKHHELVCRPGTTGDAANLPNSTKAVRGPNKPAIELVLVWGGFWSKKYQPKNIGRNKFECHTQIWFDPENLVFFSSPGSPSEKKIGKCIWAM